MKKRSSSSNRPTDLNAATHDELVTAGLSSKQAHDILDYRAEHGPWTSLEQLLAVDGIDGVALDALRASLFVQPNAFQAPAGEPGSPSGAPPDTHVDETDATDRAEGGLAMGSMEVSSAPVPDAPSLEPEDLYPVAGAIVDDEYWPEPAFSEPPSADGVVLETATHPTSQTLEDVAGTVEGDMTASLRVDEQAPACPAVADTTPAGVPCGEESTAPGQVSKSDSELKCISQTCMEETADVPSERLASADDQPVPETCEAHIGDGAYEVVSGSGAEAVDHGPMTVEAFDDDGAEVLPSPLHDGEVAGIGPGSAPLAANEGGAIETGRTEATDTSARVSPVALRPSSQSRTERGGRWHDLALVAVGGLLGVLATLVILGALGGTLNYAPRSLVDALSTNIATMQQNQETSWSQTQALAAQVTAMESRLAAVEALGSRVAELESGSAQIEARLSELRTGLQKLDSSLAEVAEQHAALIDDLSTRVVAQEQGLASVQETVSDLRGTVDEMQAQVTRYEAFFDALRDLLLEMQGDGTGADTGM